MAVPVNPPTQTTLEIEEEPTTQQFTHFDVVSDHSDHQYSFPNKLSRPSDPFTNGSSPVHKKIMKEWKILEKHLPETIYVRVYETRIDLLRAVIVGSAGTPYHDGLFFFDIAFPPDYPNKPPLVFYKSFGLRLNPNLYASGYVCLSLLNTWVGKKNEKWDPAGSTVLQVLVSLQALVLNEKPYFNEPGIGIIPGKVKKSLAYNEAVFILSCKTMIYLIRKPPKNFDEFVAMHFRERGTHFLLSCNDYINGRARVGQCGRNGHVGSVKVSKRFKAALVPLLEELGAGFTKNGASLGQLVEQMKVEKEMELSKKRKEEETATSKGVKVGKGNVFDLGKMFGKVFKCLGLMNDVKSNGSVLVNGEVNTKMKINGRVDPLEN